MIKGTPLWTASYIGISEFLRLDLPRVFSDDTGKQRELVRHFRLIRPDLKIWNAPWIRICILCRFRRCGSRSLRIFYTVHDLVLSAVSDANYNIPVPFVRIRKYMRLPIKIRYAPFILSRHGTKEFCFHLSCILTPVLKTTTCKIIFFINFVIK